MTCPVVLPQALAHVRAGETPIASSVASHAMRRAGSPGMPQRPAGNIGATASYASPVRYPVPDGPGVDRVHGDGGFGERRRRGAGDRGGGALLEGVGDLAGHACAVVLPGGRHPTGRTRRQRGAQPCVRLDQQHRADVDGPVRVGHRGVDHVEGAVAAAERVVGDEDAEPAAEGSAAVRTGGARRAGEREVAGALRDTCVRVAGVADRRADGGADVLDAAGAPGCRGVVRHMAVRADARAVGGEPARHPWPVPARRPAR
ncbi:hypothetical protein GCM10010259_46240 [Streptomyces daghestanicus]|uniref:Uncharacterized protein n=1 Tax=Streptomyces daghestanicus TaxID=66885 RepID=A0ABQ3PVA4_9ACTN|nr:hypothetical protein GCM10010259_46240 [Streptomyces daghestanicus]GHI28942.1 hypothetical protein Sdagh_06720 [Streptomyces daghestanicus]